MYLELVDCGHCHACDTRSKVCVHLKDVDDGLINMVKHIPVDTEDKWLQAVDRVSRLRIDVHKQTWEQAEDTLGCVNREVVVRS